VSNYSVCKRCVMDSTAKDISFDENGICNYCIEFLNRSEHILNSNKSQKTKDLDSLIERIKKRGQGRRYDCIVGVSGGVDSSWVLVKALESGLRPLAVHMDNGWNSELAQNNIANLVRGLNVDLHTHVINWIEYRNLMQAFFDADVIDVELLYDNAMLAVNYQQSKKYGVKYILGGMNQATEGMRMPLGWNWMKYDKKNIKDIAKFHGDVKIKSFPAISTLDYIHYELIRGIKWIPFLDNYDFIKVEALTILQNEHGYKPYPYKHYESIFTRFYQGYILPNKFGVDKRRLHLSTLVISGQMKREEALEYLEQPPYPSKDALEHDREYFVKKMKWSLEELDAYILRPPQRHDSYATEKPRWEYFFHENEKRYLYRQIKKLYKVLVSIS